MNIYITGSSGFVATNFIKHSPEYTITCLHLRDQKPENIDFSGADVVLHLAALVHQMNGAPEDQYFKINRDLTLAVAKRAKEQGVKHFVFMSTVKVYGESTTETGKWNENTACHPTDPYGKSKYDAECKLRELEDENFTVSIVRSPLVYGVGVKGNMISLVRLVAKFPFLPLGGIQNKRTMVYVGNLVALIKRIIEKKQSGVFLAGDAVALSTTELVELIGKYVNHKSHLFVLPRFVVNLLEAVKPAIIDRLWGSLELDCSRTNNILDFTPPYSQEQGIREMVNWYLQSKHK